MSYQVLARKWRPQDFATLVGQGPIVQALRNALADGRIAQAYLFSGIRGVGKTTAARVLAKALNCERGPGADPCNACTPCREITAGADLDVLEVDAATYSKVEQVRDLTASLRYGPTRDRYKVVVLDEVHRLSAAAFDALLKIVEEPPPQVVFIFATTEVEAVPATILSRCQEYAFRRVDASTLATHLSAICAAEGISASAAALRLIARAGEGSVRDSVALLDQLATFGGGTVDDQAAARLLGGLSTALWLELLGALLEGDGATVSRVVRELEDQGSDPRHAFGQFLGFCRDALHLAQGQSPEGVDLPAEEAAALARLAQGAGTSDLLRLLHVLVTSEPIIRRSEVAALAVEIAWLRASELPRLLAIERLLREGAPRDGAAARPAIDPAVPRAPRAGAAPHPPKPAAPASDPAPPVAPAAAAAAAAPSTALPAPESRASATTEPSLRAVLEGVARRRAPLAAQLAEAARLSLDGGELLIQPAATDPVLARALEREANAVALSAALTEVCGPGASWRLLAAAPAPAATGSGALVQPDLATVATHPTVQAVLDIFGGTVTTVDSLAEPAAEVDAEES